MADSEQDGFPSMDGSFRILSISDDDGLRYSRELLLTRDGYETESVSSDVVLSAERARSFDAVLICRSVDPKRGLALTEALERYNPGIQILCIGPVESGDGQDYSLPVLQGPQALLGEVRKMRMSATSRKMMDAPQ